MRVITKTGMGPKRVGEDPLVLWKDGEVVLFNAAHPFSQDLLDLPCIDTAYTSPANRYGRFIDNHWESVPVEDFPKEFRVAALLLGYA